MTNNRTHKKEMARRQAERRGRFSEIYAAFYLRLKGFHILQRRYRSPVGEIDLIAKRGNLVVIVEVKARQGFDDAVFAVTPQAQRRISRATGMFLSRNSHLYSCALRYDIIAVVGGRLRHIRDAWRDDDRGY